MGPDDTLPGPGSEPPPGSDPNPGSDPTPGSDPALVGRLRSEIERTGPITFARFMDVALFDPDRGYYARSASRGTREGDFLTAPELHPVFGRCLGRQLTECWERLGEPDTFVLREYGAGSGRLAIDVLRGLEADGSPLAGHLVYEPIEIGPRRLADLEGLLRAAGLGGILRRPHGPIAGVVLANEFLDALPVHRVEGGDPGLRELYVGWEGETFVDIAGEPSTPGLAARLRADGIELAPGQRGEVCLGLGSWIGEVADGLERGYALIIDYGHPAHRLYSRERWAGSLLGYLGHRVVDDPYANVGRQDLTAHVDLTALEREAVVRGLSVVGRTTQARLLAGLGLGELLAEASGGTTDGLVDYLELRAAAVRLLDPRALGGFVVTVLGRDVPGEPPLRGLAFRLPSGD